ncbi:MAG: trimeric intracellular cation channel family protein [Clostridia bacterium]|nr:trimeric intracellular cation channel family protein [Clostridia bacterium]
MTIICVIGTVAFSVSGAMVAIKKHADIFGAVTLAVVTATGGGMVRDILLGIQPPHAFLDSRYIFIAAAAALIVFLIAYIGKDAYISRENFIDSVNNIFDALGLGVFVVMGTQTAIDYGFSQNALLSVFIGTLTGIGGGFLRDIMVHEIPSMLKKHIYALAALSGSLIFYIMYTNSLGYTLSAFFGATATFLLRMLATRFKWNLPPAY